MSTIRPRPLRAGPVASFVALGVTLATLSGVPAGAHEGAPAQLSPGADRGFGAASTPAPAAQAVGVIVKRRASSDGADIAATVSAAVASHLGAEGADDLRTTAVAARTRAYRTEVLPAAQAEELAAAIAAEPGVEWAVPDRLNQIAESPWPTPVNDPHASKLRNLWDMRAVSDDSILAQLNPTPWPAGGVGTKAPALWPATTGAGVTVAVIDTGVRTNHPDLAPNLVAGYDFVSAEQGGGLSNANDGNGRDPDASDPGDWQDGTQCNMGTGSRPSSWHGSHVAGTIAALANNGIGVAGVAPGARILPVRVLGRCGGATSDIVAGMIWAAGGSVPGVPANPNPAKVLNMSLGGTSPTCEAAYADAINAVRALGATIVTAAGNEGQPASNASPGNCAGVVNVHSVSDYGDHAGYSNYGQAIDISAPGGDDAYEGIEIYSTVDSGTTTPVAPAYAYKSGTSMAAPAVSGGAALLASLGSFGPDQMEAALKGAVMGFPTSQYFTQWGTACNTTQCGTGILDLTQVPAPTSAPVISGSPTPGGTLSATTGTWTGPAATISITWLADGAVVAEGPSYAVGTADAGKSIQAVAHVVGGLYAPIGRASAPVAIPARVASAISLKVPRKVRKGKRAKGTVTLRVAGAAAAGTVRVTIKAGRRTTTLTIAVPASGKATFKLPRIKRKTKVMADFAGSANVAASATGWATVKVKKAKKRKGKR